MRNRELWEKLDGLASQERSNSRDWEFMKLLKTAYDDDLKIFISCVEPLDLFGESGDEYIHQGYLKSDGNRFLICYTSSEHARRERRRGENGGQIGWATAKAREIMNNMFNKKAVTGLVFNPEDNKMVIILKSELEQLMPGPKPKPPFFRESW